MAKSIINSIDVILNDKATKVKEKVSSISQLLIDGSVSIHQLIVLAKSENETNKATIIESMEFASIGTIEKREEDNAIKKIYQQGLKKAAK